MTNFFLHYSSRLYQYLKVVKESVWLCCMLSSPSKSDSLELLWRESKAQLVLGSSVTAFLLCFLGKK